MRLTHSFQTALTGIFCEDVMTYQGTNPTSETINYKDIGSSPSATVPTGFQAIVLRNGRFYFKNAAGLEQPLPGTLFNFKGDQSSTFFSSKIVPISVYPNSQVVQGCASDGYNYVLVVAANQGCARSSDGSKWTSISNPVASPLAAAGTTGKLMIAGPGQTSISTDGGFTWSGAVSQPNNPNCRLRYLNNAWFSCGDSGINRSPDGITWTSVATGKPPLQDMDFGNGNYVCVGGADASISFCCTSPDGITWTNRTLPTVARVARSVVYNSSQNRWVIVGDNGASWTSTDTVTWTYTLISSGNPFYVIWNIGNVFMACDKYGSLVTTSTGAGWSNQGSILGFSFSTNEVSYAGRLPDRPWLSDGTSSQKLYMYPIGPGLVPGTDRFTGVATYGTGEVALMTSGASATGFDVALIAGIQGTLHKAIQTTRYVDAVIDGSAAGVWANSVQGTFTNNASTVMGSWVNAIGMNLSPGIYRVQGSCHFTITTTVNGTSLELMVGLGLSTWNTGTSGASLRFGENASCVGVQQTTGPFPTRYTLLTPWIYLQVTSTQIIHMFASGNATQTSTTLSILTQMAGTATVTPVTRYCVITVHKF